MKSRKVNPASRKSLADLVIAMPRSEHRKLARFLLHIELLGDVEKAARHVGVSSKQLKKWTSMADMSWAIEHHLSEAKRIAKGIPLPLYFTDETENDGLFWAKLVSKNLKGGKQILLQAADDKNSKFFIDLGKCLSGEIDSTPFDLMDLHLAGLLNRYPSITAKDVVDQLVRVGFPRITEENFRVRKQRLKGKLRIA
jgi:hypothetical protein